MLKRYAFPQGDIATAMSEAAEIRGASRGVVGYDSVSLISSMKSSMMSMSKHLKPSLNR